ncbi:TPA: YmfL family putative regulatory protein [Salmonella enterica subsp. diarizonae serovar 61:r:-]
MNSSQWKVEKQPQWYTKAVKKTIAALPGGYAEAAEWLDVTENALFNRLRAGGDQIFPMGWAMLLQQASGTHFVADAIARASGGEFIPLADIDDVDNADINQRLLEAMEELGVYSQKVRAAIEDGVIDRREREEIDAELHRVIVRMQEHTSLVFRVFCPPEKGDARECAAPGTVASYGMEKTNA